MQSLIKTTTLLANPTFRFMYMRSAAFATSSSKGKKDSSLGQEKDFVNKQEQQITVIIKVFEGERAMTLQGGPHSTS